MKNEIVKQQMRLNAYLLVNELINQGESFRIILWNNDDWSVPLPDNVMEAYPEQLILDIKDETLEDSYC